MGRKRGNSILAKSESQLLQKHKSKAIEWTFVVTYVVILAIMVLATLAAGDNPSIIYVHAIVLALCISPVTAFMGGLRYEVGREKLIIRSGLLRIPIKRIPLESIRYRNTCSHLKTRRNSKVRFRNTSQSISDDRRQRTDGGWHPFRRRRKGW